MSTKADLASEEQIERAKQYLKDAGAGELYVTSAVTGDGVNKLVEDLHILVTREMHASQCGGCKAGLLCGSRQPRVKTASNCCTEITRKAGMRQEIKSIGIRHRHLDDTAGIQPYRCGKCGRQLQCAASIDC